MTITSEIELTAQLKWRYACKAFDPTQKLTPEQWTTLAESLHLSPSSYGLQPWKFLVVQATELRRELRLASWNKGQVEDCSHFVVFTTLKTMSEDYVNHYIERIAEVRNVEASTLEGYRQVILGSLVNGDRSGTIQHWAQRQAYIAMGTLLTTAAYMKVDTCPLEGISAQDYDRILGLETSNYGTVAAVALGFRSADDKYQHAPKVRFDINEVIEYQ